MNKLALGGDNLIAFDLTDIQQLDLVFVQENAALHEWRCDQKLAIDNFETFYINSWLY